MSLKTVKIIDGICIVLFLFMGIYIFALPDGMQDKFLPVFQILNPFRLGIWIITIGFFVTCVFGEGRTGLVLGIVMLICYVITAFVSLFDLMALVSNLELLWYLHPILAVAGIIIAIRKKLRKSEQEA